MCCKGTSLLWTPEALPKELRSPPHPNSKVGSKERRSNTVLEFSELWFFEVMPQCALVPQGRESDSGGRLHSLVWSRPLRDLRLFGWVLLLSGYEAIRPQPPEPSASARSGNGDEAQLCCLKSAESKEAISWQTFSQNAPVGEPDARAEGTGCAHLPGSWAGWVWRALLPLPAHPQHQDSCKGLSSGTSAEKGGQGPEGSLRVPRRTRPLPADDPAFPGRGKRKAPPLQGCIHGHARFHFKCALKRAEFLLDF